MTPTVEVLELISPLEQHVLAVKKMPRLRLLHVSLPRATLQQVKLLNQLFELPAFQRLELDCPFEAALPGLRFATPLAPLGLRWLRSGLHPLRSALSLIRAHAGTLEELELVAATTEPYGCPDLAGELRRCGLKKLRVLRLLRGSHCYVCKHNSEKCKIQKLEIYSGLLEAGAICEVECSKCC
ncbi:hypothetical protein ONE63_004506 [Megalurothrips usitatus]|uniref:Uncharacterized protein n=1 Tax=Megalurothrips usitatus TaxID=439358 RepID=A0AAV7X6J6_9NEOP|nr:hypothetical protein ONE63_004506 [Megalurothrips usitatus]